VALGHAGVASKRGCLGFETVSIRSEDQVFARATTTAGMPGGADVNDIR
jgi:hypothetical protein